MAFDLSSLQKAVVSFEKTLAVACSKEKMDKLDDDQRDAIRSGVIQNFEFTYELSWKFIKRWLGNSFNDSHVDGMTRRELFRLASEHQLIDCVDTWMEYHDARNDSAHTYDKKKADDVFSVAQD
ncbi:Protein of unknown function DUF86, Caur_2869 group, partial [hydrothermal vent metagenome]